MVKNPGAAEVWQWLEQVTDPEIPVISVIELGIVREVDVLADGSCSVTITPWPFTMYCAIASARLPHMTPSTHCVGCFPSSPLRP